MILELSSTPFKERSSNCFKDLHKPKLLANLDVNLISFPHPVCAVQAEGCRTKSFPQPVLRTLSPYCIPSARTAHPQPVLRALSSYCTPSARTAYPQPVLRILSLHCTCTAEQLKDREACTVQL